MKSKSNWVGIAFAAISLLILLYYLPVLCADSLQDEKKTPLSELSGNRISAAKKIIEVYDVLEEKGRGPTNEEYYIWSIRLLESELDAPEVSRDISYKNHYERMKSRSDRIRLLNRAGVVGTVDVAKAEYYHAEAKYWLNKR